MATERPEEDEDTETKLAILSSIFTRASHESLFEVLIQADGDVERAIDLHPSSTRRSSRPESPERPSKRRKTSPQKPHNASPDGKSLSDVLKWTSSAEPPRKVTHANVSYLIAGTASHVTFIPP